MLLDLAYAGVILSPNNSVMTPSYSTTFCPGNGKDKLARD